MKTSNQTNAQAQATPVQPVQKHYTGDLYDHVTLSIEQTEWLEHLIYQVKKDMTDMLELLKRDYGVEIHEARSHSVRTGLNIIEYLLGDQRNQDERLAAKILENDERENTTQAEIPAKVKPSNQQVH